MSNKSTKADGDFSISRMISREDLPIHLGQIHQDIVDSAPSSPADFGDSGTCFFVLDILLDQYSMDNLYNRLTSDLGKENEIFCYS